MEHDNNIKTKLEKRRIQPSSNSWDRLEMMLDEKEVASSKNGFLNYAIAASVLLLLSVPFLMNSNFSGTDITPTVVDEKVLHDTFEDKKEVLKTKDIETSIVESTENKTLEKGLLKKESSVKENKYERENSANNSRINISVFAANIKHSNKTVLTTQKNDKVVVSSSFTPENINTNEAVVEKLTKESLELEVDALLASALKGLSKKPTEIIQKDMSVTVDSDALLADVEEELDLSFKAKVFNKLKNGFQKTQAAVVKRND